MAPAIVSLFHAFCIDFETNFHQKIIENRYKIKKQSNARSQDVKSKNVKKNPQFLQYNRAFGLFMLYRKIDKNEANILAKTALQLMSQVASILEATRPPKTLQNRGPKASKIDEKCMSKLTSLLHGRKIAFLSLRSRKVTPKASKKGVGREGPELTFSMFFAVLRPLGPLSLIHI